MLTQMRSLSQSWIGRGIMAVVLGFIIVSFAVWGIGDRFNNFNASELAQVGSTKITVNQYRDAYQNQLQRLQQQQKRGITNEEAHRLGVDRQVLSRLLSDAILDQQAARLSLAVGDAEIAKTIMGDAAFKGPGGKFDRTRFLELLQANGLSENGYVKDQRGILLRQDVSDAVIGGLEVPKTMEDAIHRYQSEVRDIMFFVLPPSAAGALPKPSDADLSTFYEQHPAAFEAPEYRKLVTLSVAPVNLVKPGSITDDDVKKRYEEMKELRFVVPEKRTVQQLFFPDAKAAAAAKAKLDGGESFDKLVSDEKKKPADVRLGTVAKQEITDKAIGDAAFALANNATSAAIQGQFGTALVHVSKIEPVRQRPLTEVSAQLKDEMAIIRAKSEATKIRDKIEDQRTAGKTLAEAASSVGLTPRTIEAIDSQGRDKQHRPVENLVDGPALLKAAFGSDVGADTEMIQTSNGGDDWYEVAGIEPAHKLPLNEVKARVEAGWQNDEIARRLAAEGDKLVEAINGGKAPKDVAASHGKLQVIKATNVGRSGAPNLPPTLPSAIFQVNVGKAGSASDGRSARAIFKVEAAHVPPPDPKDEEFAKVMGQVKTGFQDDVIAEYLARVENEIGVKMNATALQSALSGDAGS